MATILIVGDDRRTALALRRRLTRLGHTVLRPVTSAVVALAMVRVIQPEAVFLGHDLRGDLDGLMVSDLIEAAGIPVIALADVPRAQRTADPQGTALRFSLAKPITDEALVRTLAWALRCSTFERTLQDLTPAGARVIGRRPQALAPATSGGVRRTRRLCGVGLLLVTGVALMGCATTAPVYLRHPPTGRVAQCGPYPSSTTVRASLALLQERLCIRDYERLGYERVPSPTD